MREMGVRGLLVYCSDYHCSHWTAISGDQWPDDVRLSDIEPRFTCQECGCKGADLRPNFHWEREARQASVGAGTFALTRAWWAGPCWAARRLLVVLARSRS